MRLIYVLSFLRSFRNRNTFEYRKRKPYMGSFGRYPFHERIKFSLISYSIPGNCFFHRLFRFGIFRNIGKDKKDSCYRFPSPILPGKAVYDAIKLAIHEDTHLFLENSISILYTTLSMALGIIAVKTIEIIFSKIFNSFSKKHK